MRLRRLLPGDRRELIAVYRDAVLSQTTALYSDAQVRAWADHAAGPADPFANLERRYGLASLEEPQEQGRGEAAALARAPIAAFGLLDAPAQHCCRLALLYCRGHCARQGRAQTLLMELEAEARRWQCRLLRTEASQLSRPLLLRHGWRIERQERLIFAGQPFERWRMIKPLI